MECDINNCHREATWFTVYFRNEYGYCTWHAKPIRYPQPKKKWR